MMHDDPAFQDEIRLRRLAILGELLPEVVHEINNLMSAVSGYAQIELFNGGTAKPKDSLRKILDCAKQMSELTRNVLHFVKPPAPGAGDAGEAIQRVLDLLGRRIRNEQVRIDWDPRSFTPPVAVGTGDLQLVVANLVKNALDALEGQPSPEICLSVSKTESDLILDVWNSGPPIPDDILPRLFTPFVTTKPPERGTGLGLSVCRRLLSHAGGEIVASNPEGGGVLFSLQLPRATRPAAREIPSVATAAPRLDGRRILVVDDENTIREMLRMMMSKTSGALVDTCGSGNEALQLLREKAFDAVILDLRMPGMSGQELYDVLPKSLQRRVVFVTGDTLGSSTTRFLATTHQPALFKPVDHADLVQAVQQVIAAE